MRKRNGQSLVESTLILLVFLSILLGVLDVAQVLFTHQSLANRVNTAVRWAGTQKWQGVEPVRNMVLYSQASEPRSTTEGYLGLKPENVLVSYRPPTVDRPDDESLTVEVVNFESHLFSPWISRTLVTHRPVFVSMPVGFSREIQVR